MIAHRGPRDLLALLPASLRRTPVGELLLVTTHEDNPATAAIYRVDLTVPPQELTVRCGMAVQHAAAAGVTHAVLVVYPGPGDSGDPDDLDSAASLAAASIVVLAEHAHLNVLDSLRVVGDRWWSYECIDTSCCPPEGNPLPTPGETP